MKRHLIAWLCLSASVRAFAQHEGHEQAEAPAEGESPPPAAFAGPAHAADALFDPELMAAARARLRAEEGGLTTHLLLADRFESRFGDGEESYAWDLHGWYGGDIWEIVAGVRAWF